MKCNKIMKIIHDYIDGELAPKESKRVEEHLASCTECRNLEKAIRQTAIEPFEKAEKIQAPERVWDNIRESITEEKRSYIEIIRDRLEYTFARHKLALAAVSVTVVIACFLILANIDLIREDPVNSFLNEQLNYLTGLGANGETMNGSGDIDFGTDIEKYFL
ncbi:MAG: zf-HC2 domain-containing protein [Candidatus Omnitrophota bacterium]